MVCTKLTCSVIYKKCPVAKWEDSVCFFFDDRDIATAITARHIPIIRHFLQHSWWSAWRYVLLGNNKNQERSVKEKNFMVYWERLNGMFGYTWGRHYEIS